LEYNNGFANYPTILEGGDIAVPVGVPIPTACRIGGFDLDRLFPSCPTSTEALSWREDTIIKKPRSMTSASQTP
jgi:hypothetical protein